MKHLHRLTLLLASPLFLLATPTPASAAPAASVDIESVRLLAHGAGLQLDLTGTCDAGTAEDGSITATVTQKAGRRVAQGDGSAYPLTCDGDRLRATVIITADVSGGPFHVGDALVAASLASGCCNAASVQEVVRIGR